MSSSHTVSYTCPYCGKEFEVEVYDVVEASKDPDLRERSISGDIFHHTCPHCQKEFLLMNPLLYVDRERKFVIYVSEEQPPKEMLDLGSRLNAKHYTLRRCPTVREFTEKIQQLEDGIDDRLAELAKYDSFIDVIEQKKAQAEEITSVEYQSRTDDVVKVNVRFTEGRGMGFMIPFAGLQEEFDADRDLYRVDNASFPVVNEAWIVKLFENTQMPDSIKQIKPS